MVCCASPCCVTRIGAFSSHECYSHASSCGTFSGACAFFVPRAGAVMLLSGDRRAGLPTVYLDARGEEDIGVRRGKPMFLSDDRVCGLRRAVRRPGTVNFYAGDAHMH